MGQTAAEQLCLDLEVDRVAIAMLEGGIETCRSLGDEGAREPLEPLLSGEQAHTNWIEAPPALIRQAGEHRSFARRIRAEP